MKLKGIKFLAFFISLIASLTANSQSWQDVGGGTNNSSHGMLVWDGKLVNLGSYNNPCQRVSTWDGTNWNCLGGGVGIVARAGCVWNGNLVVVGDFWNNFQPCVGCNGIAVWDGTTWTALDQGFNNDVLTCTVHNGDLYIGGDFTQANGVPVNRVVRWDDVAGQFVSLGAPGDMDNDVRCMTSYDGDLWVGGDFNNVAGCSPCDGLVKWDEVGGVWEGGNSGVDLVGGVNETVRVLYVNPGDGNLYMGGEFPELWDGDAVAQDFNMSGIAMYDGSNWYPLGTGLNEYCRAIHEYNGYVIAGGYFTNAGGTPAQKIAKWNPGAQTWTAMGGGFDGGGIDEYVKSATVWNGIFFAGGAYTQAEGGPMNYIAQWYEPPTNPPTAGINASGTSICEGGCLTFQDNSLDSPTSWTWDFPGSSAPSSTAEDPGSICWPSAGTYTVQLEACNINGCDIITTNVTVTATPTLSVNDQTICDGQSATLVATPSTGGGTFDWISGGETTSSITVNPSSTTSYNVQYTLNGCASVIESGTVTVNPTPTVTVNNATICQGDNTSLTATPSAGGGTFDWITTSETTQSISVAPTSTSSYDIEYTLNGCTSTVATATVTVNPVYNLNENLSICEGDLVTYPDASTETISSSTSHISNLSSVDGCDSIITSNVTMISDFAGTESAFVCEGNDFTYPDGTVSTNVLVAETHVSNLLSVSGCDSIVTTNLNVTTAFTGSESIAVCEGDDYTYPDGSTSTNIIVPESHVSNLTSVGGCDSTITTNLTVNTLFAGTESSTICEGDDFTYPDGTTSTNILVDESHVSNLLTVDGCDSTVTTNLTVVAAPNSGTTENANIITADQAGATYQWVDCNNSNTPITGETGQSFAPTANGSYAVEITLNGCTTTSSCTVISTIGFAENELWHFTIFPNPVHNELTISSQQEVVEIRYAIMDPRGRIVLSGILQDKSSIDISQLECGVYIIQINEGQLLRFVKQ